jgi:hypothetical protein
LPVFVDDVNPGVAREREFRAGEKKANYHIFTTVHGLVAKKRQPGDVQTIEQQWGKLN